MPLSRLALNKKDYQKVFCVKLLCGFFVLFLIGCFFPRLFVDQPGASGRVVDLRTGLAITVAEIKLETEDMQRNPIVLSTTTTADGRFLMPAKESWGVIAAPFDPVHFTCTVSITARGYESASIKFVTRITGPAITDLGEIRLKKG